MEFERALKMPLDDPNWLVKILIGGALTIIPIVNLLSHGYALEAMRRSINGRPEMPDWDDWGDKFVKGLAALFICLVYYIPLLIIMGVGGGLGALMNSGMGTGLFFATGYTIGFILVLFIGFVIPMALAHYIATGSVGSAFALGVVLGKIRERLSDYAVAYVMAVVMLFLVNFVGKLPIIGWLLSAFLYFYVLIVIAVLFGAVYSRTVDAV